MTRGTVVCGVTETPDGRDAAEAEFDGGESGVHGPPTAEGGFFAVLGDDRADHFDVL